MIWTIIGVFIPFVGTTLGAAVAMLSRKNAGETASKLLIGFAAGVMLAASIWSLIMPSIELASKRGIVSFLPASIGFAVGVGALIALDLLLPSEPNAKSARQNKMLVLAVSVHNVPEGMAVGAIFAGLMAGGTEITFASAVSLSVGIALQNIPEGAIVAMPFLLDGKSKLKAFILGVLSGAVEPLAAFATIALYVVAVTILPYLLSFAAGAMTYVIVKELMPELKEGNAGVIGLTIGFLLMMIMDLSL